MVEIEKVENLPLKGFTLAQAAALKQLTGQMTKRVYLVNDQYKIFILQNQAAFLPKKDFHQTFYTATHYLSYPKLGVFLRPLNKWKPERDKIIIPANVVDKGFELYTVQIFNEPPFVRLIPIPFVSQDSAEKLIFSHDAYFDVPAKLTFPFHWQGSQYLSLKSAAWVKIGDAFILPDFLKTKTELIKHRNFVLAISKPPILFVTDETHIRVYEFINEQVAAGHKVIYDADKNKLQLIKMEVSVPELEMPLLATYPIEEKWRC